MCHIHVSFQTLRQYRDNQSDTEVLMSALSAMQDKAAHLETSLSAETKLKLDLFSALGEAKRQIEIQQGLFHMKHMGLFQKTHWGQVAGKGGWGLLQVLSIVENKGAPSAEVGGKDQPQVQNCLFGTCGAAVGCRWKPLKATVKKFSLPPGDVIWNN